MCTLKLDLYSIEYVQYMHVHELLCVLEGLEGKMQNLK